MDKPITLAPRQDLGRYLQSLDSVRFAESDIEACTIQARVEILVSLLFGQTIPIGEHQFLDSVGFISSAVELIKSKNLVDRKDRNIIKTIFPFRLGIRKEYSTIDNLIAIKLGNVDYKLSLPSWQCLNNNHNLRNEIKKKHHDGNFKFDDLYALIPSERQAVDDLKLIRDQFNEGKKGQISTLYKKPTVTIAPYIGLLQQGLSEIISWNESDLQQQVELELELIEKGYQLKATIEPELITPAVKLIEALKSLHEEGVSYENRSDIRKPKYRDVVTEDDKFESILEIYDSLYNSSIAKAVNAHSEGASSARNIQDNVYVRAALTVANLARNNVTSFQSNRKKPLKPIYLGEFNWAHETNFDILKDKKEELVLEKIPWEVVWQAFLDPTWQNSLSHLNTAYTEWDDAMKRPVKSADIFMGLAHKLNDAISHHSTVIQKILSGSIIQLHKNSKTEDLIFDMTTVAGPFLVIGAEFVINEMGLAIDSSKIQLLKGAIPVAGMALKYSLSSIKTWRTSGQIRKIFNKIYETDN